MMRRRRPCSQMERRRFRRPSWIPIPKKGRTHRALLSSSSSSSEGAEEAGVETLANGASKAAAAVEATYMFRSGIIIVIIIVVFRAELRFTETTNKLKILYINLFLSSVTKDSFFHNNNWYRYTTLSVMATWLWNRSRMQGDLYGVLQNWARRLNTDLLINNNLNELALCLVNT